MILRKVIYLCFDSVIQAYRLSVKLYSTMMLFANKWLEPHTETVQSNCDYKTN